MDLAERLDRMERRSRLGWPAAGGLALAMGLGFAQQEQTPRSYVLADGQGRVCRLTPEGLWVGQNQKSPDGRWQVVWTNQVHANGIEMAFGRAKDANGFVISGDDRPQMISLTQDDGLRIARWDFARSVASEVGLSNFQDQAGVVRPYVYAKVNDPAGRISATALLTEHGTDVRK